jgi:leucyl/phenylalanyl-tRNA---protein transferase
MATKIPPRELLALYAGGWFPMAGPDGDIRLHSPDPRGILPLDGFRVPHGSRKAVRDPAWETRVDTCFGEVVAMCARRREGTWIDARIMASYLALHGEGFAHSVEIWRDGRLAGGLYGVRLGAAFFGESMFHVVPGASKAALAALVERLRCGGFHLLDIQWVTPHLARFGATAIPRARYLDLLGRALRTRGEWNPSRTARQPAGENHRHEWRWLEPQRGSIPNRP